MADQAITNLDQGKPSIIKGLSTATKNSSRSTGNEWTDEIFRTQRRAKPTEKSTNTLSLGNINGHYGENVDFEDFYETQHYTLICRISQKFFESIKYIMVSRAVGIAFEGQNLGNDGTLSLIQIATESRVIMFDMIRLGNQAFGAGLRILLESEQLIKVIHDCRWISNLLRNQHQIVMANIFDTQVANAFVSRNLNGGKWPSNVESLHNCLKKYLNIPSQDLNSILIKELYI